MDSNFLILIVIGVLVIGVPIYMKIKKNKAKKKSLLSQRQDKDEVWKTIKQFLHNNNESGANIADSYVVKRNSIDYINPKCSAANKKIFNELIKLRKFINKNNKNITPLQEIYTVVFRTMNAKLNTYANYRCFDCEVQTTKINRKESSKKILIIGEKDYNKEML
jgi:hypothetical protein